jgi:lysozyme
MTRAQGIDVSHWNGKMDFAKAKAAGISFVYIKANQLSADASFATYWAGAKMAGLLRGAYHFLDWTTSEMDQARLFVNLLKSDPGELPPVCDFESPYNVPVKSIATTKLHNFLDYVEKNTGKVPMIYVSYYYMIEHTDCNASFLHYPVWLAWYSPENVIKPPPPWMKWTFWQYTSSGIGSTYGSDSDAMDLNWYNGTEDELRTWAGVSTTVPVTVPVVIPSNTYETNTAVNVRSGPLDTDPVITVLSKGITVIVDKVNGNRSYITTPLSGWIWTAYLTPVATLLYKTCPTCGGTGKVSGDS